MLRSMLLGRSNRGDVLKSGLGVIFPEPREESEHERC